MVGLSSTPRPRLESSQLGCLLLVGILNLLFAVLFSNFVCFTIPEKSFMGRGSFKGQTIRKVMEGRGIFSLHEFFLQVKPSARIFFLSDKYCFVCHLLIKTNYFTKELLYFVGFNNN